MGNTPSDSSASSAGDDIWDIWQRDDEEEARLIERASAGGNDTTGMSVTGADGVTGAMTGTGADATGVTGVTGALTGTSADATGVTGVTGETTTGAPVAKHNWAAANTKASEGKDATTGKDETTGTGNAGKAEATGGSGVCVAGAPGEYAAAEKRDETGNAGPLPSDSEPSGPEAAPAAGPPTFPWKLGPKGELSPSMIAAQALDPEFAYDLCGLEPGPDEDFEDYIPEPRIKESRLTPEEKKKYLGLIDEIFHPDSIVGARVRFEPDDVVEVCDKVIPYLESEQTLIEDLPFNIIIVADLHGQLWDLERVFKAEERDGKPGWENTKYLFLGDYVDRGRQSLEIVMALFCLKMIYPDQIFLLRGNHEYVGINLKGGFLYDFIDRYHEEVYPLIYYKVNEAFCYLSVAAIVGNTYFCCHGGISPQAFTRRALLAIDKPILEDKQDQLIHDLEWADPALGLKGTTFNGMRQCSVYFGLDELAFALYNMECTGLFRGHSIMDNGFEVVGGLCVSLFTASGSRNFNDGAIAIIDAEGAVSFDILVCNPSRVAWVNQLRRMDGASADLPDDCLTVEDDSGEGGTVDMKDSKM